MTDAEAQEAMQKGFETLAHFSRLIAMLPLEEWQEALNRAETLGPFVDPTMYREYLHSDKPKVIKAIIAAAIPLKKAILDAQPAVRRQMEREAKV